MKHRSAFILILICFACSESVEPYNKYTDPESPAISPVGKIMEDDLIRLTFPPGAVDEPVEISVRTEINKDVPMIFFTSDEKFVRSELFISYDADYNVVEAYDYMISLEVTPSLTFNRPVSIQFKIPTHVFRLNNNAVPKDSDSWSHVAEVAQFQSPQDLLNMAFIGGSARKDVFYIDRSEQRYWDNYLPMENAVYDSNRQKYVVSVSPKYWDYAEFLIFFKEKPQEGKTYTLANSSENGYNNTNVNVAEIIGGYCNANGCYDYHDGASGNIKFLGGSDSSGKFMFRNVKLRKRNDSATFLTVNGYL